MEHMQITGHRKSVLLTICISSYGNNKYCRTSTQRHPSFSVQETPWTGSVYQTNLNMYWNVNTNSYTFRHFLSAITRKTVLHIITIYGHPLHTVTKYSEKKNNCVIREIHCVTFSYSLLHGADGLQLVKKFPAFHGTRRFITALTSVRHLSLSWANTIQSTYPHPTTWRTKYCYPS